MKEAHSSLTLVNKLVECVLPVGPGLSPHDGPGLVVDSLATAGHVFPITLHVPLLEIGRKSVQVLETGSIWTVPQMSIIIIYNSTWSILIQ